MPSPLRIFVSSPGDVREERLRAQLIIAKLARDYAGLVEVQPYFWESEPLRASSHFQDEIEPPSQHDIVVLILWSRLGTPLPVRTAVREYTGMDGRTPVTGTEWEFEDALAAFQLRNTPDLLVYRRSGDPGTSLTDAALRAEQERQWHALQAFWTRHFEDKGQFLAASARYDSLEAFDARLEADLAKLIERRLLAASDGLAPAHLKGPPYRGLSTYDFPDAPVFFGRDGAIRNGLLRLSAAAAERCGFLMVLGASGSGKSSLARAGLLPALVAAKAVPGVGLWRRVVMRPGDAGADPIAALAGALLAGSPARGEGMAELAGPGTGAAELARHLRASIEDASYPFRTALGTLGAQERSAKALLSHEEARLVLLVDQLEELFTRPDIVEDDRIAFVRLLAGLARSGMVWVIATMRSDLWHRAAGIPELLALTEEGARLDLLPPDGAELLEVIRRPARATGLQFEENEARIGLDAVLAEAAAAEPGALPLLSVVLEDLYRRDVAELAGRRLTFAAYRAMGELKGAIATRAEMAWTSVHARDPQAAEALPEVLRTLVTSSAGEAVTSRPSRLDAFGEASPARRLIEVLLAPDIRLLTAEGDARQTSLRLSHEALIEHWPRARAQIRADRRDIETRSRLESLLKPYEEAPAGGQRSRALLTGLPLEEGIDLVQRWAIPPATALGAFVGASARRARARRNRSYAIAAALVLVFAGLSVVAWLQRGVAEQQRATAQTQTRLAESETRRANARTEEADRQTVEAERQRGIAAEQSRLAQLSEEGMTREKAEAQRQAAEAQTQKRTAERRTAEANRAREDGLRAESLTLASLSRRLTDEGRIDLAQATALEAMPRSFDPLDRPVVGQAFDVFKRASQFDPILAQWTVRDGRNPLSVLFTRDGKSLVVGTNKGQVLIYDLEERRLRHQVFVFDDVVTDLALDADGTRVVASGGKEPKVVEIATGKIAYALPPNEKRFVKTAVFTADGRHLVTGAANGTISVVDAQTGRLVRTIAGPPFEPAYAAYLAMGADAAGGADPIVRAVQQASHGIFGGTTLVAVSPDSQLIASAGQADPASAVRLFDLATGEPVAELLGHRKGMGFLASVNGLVFSADGRTLVSGSDDGTARIWDVETRTLRHVVNGWSPVNAVDIDPSGTRVLTAHSDGSARLWNAVDGSQIALLLGHTQSIAFARFSPDGEMIATAASDNSARLWSGLTGASLAILPGTGVFHQVAFAEDGDRLATVSRDGQVRLLRSRSSGNAVIRVPRGARDSSTGTLPELTDSDPAVHVGFSRDGSRVVAASQAYGKLTLWDLDRLAWMGDVDGKRFAHRRPGTDMIATYEGPLDQRSPTVEKQVDGTERWIMPPDPAGSDPFKTFVFTNQVSDFDWILRGDGKRAVGFPDWVDPNVKTDHYGSSDKVALKLIDTETRKGLADIVSDGWVGRPFFTRDGSKVIARLNKPDGQSRPNGQRFAAWNADTGAFLGASADIDKTDLLELSLDGRFLAVAAKNDSRVTLFDTVQSWRRWETYADDSITAIGLSNGAAFLAIGTANGRVEVIDTRSFTTVVSIQPSQKSILKILISEDDRLVAVADQTGALTVWSRESGTPLAEARMPRPPRVMRFSPQSDRLVSLLDDGSLHVLTDGFGKWDIAAPADIVDWGRGMGSASLSPLDRKRLNLGSERRVAPERATFIFVSPEPLSVPPPAARTTRSTALSQCDMAAGDGLDRDRQADIDLKPISDPAAALSACDAALQEAPTDRLLRYQRGRALMALGRRAEAMLAFRDAAHAGHAAAMWALAQALRGTVPSSLPEMGTVADWSDRALTAGDPQALTVRARERAETATSDADMTEVLRYGLAAGKARPATLMLTLGSDVETMKAVPDWRRRAVSLYEIGLVLVESEIEAPSAREETWRRTAIDNLRNHVRAMPKAEVIAMRREAVRFVQDTFRRDRADRPEP